MYFDSIKLVTQSLLNDTENNSLLFLGWNEAYIALIMILLLYCK